MTAPLDRPLSYWIALALMGFEEDLARLMEKKGVLKADLAKAMGVTPPFVTKALNGTGNFQLKTMAKFARAVGAVLEVRLTDEGSEVVRIVDAETAVHLDEARREDSRSGLTELIADVIDFGEHRARFIGERAQVASTSRRSDIRATVPTVF